MIFRSYTNILGYILHRLIRIFKGKVDRLQINGFFFSFKNILIKKSVCQNNIVSEMGKRKVKTEGHLQRMILPSEYDVLGIAIKMLGSERIMVKCQDGKERLCRIRGKLKRRVWVREGDVVLVSPWDFQSDTRGDIFWRYRRNQVEWLRNHGYLKM
jgi:translation initiation factor 1A